MADSLKELEHRAAEALRALLEQVPAIGSTDIELEAQGVDRRADILARVNIAGRRHVLICEVKSSSQPRHVRMAVLQLRDYVAHYEAHAIPIFIAPYLSPEAQALCREHEVGFLDLEGNARLVFDGVFIERLVAAKPPVERRELRSIFKPKSAQVLRVMLRDPWRAWRVTDLAEAAGVSLGHISNVRVALLDREWAGVKPDGLTLTQPDALLDAWRDAYEPPAGQRLSFYTILHGRAFEDAARPVLGASEKDGRAIFASFSAAHWLAPYARVGSQFFYADEAGLEALRQALKLSPAAKGENVIVTRLEDHGLFRDAIEPAPGIVCTSQVQTYLDLAAAGERGREAADHLRRERLIWPR
ncbi:MAG: type IV toxin-antitoxin system AbiEi family antitoxin [Rhodopila sp.]